jgi:hypothetical protein
MHRPPQASGESVFPDLDAGVAQDCVSGGAMEIEVRHGHVQQTLPAAELRLVAKMVSSIPRP